MLQREVEAPRTSASVWLPLMALVSAAMLTIVSGIAVMTRKPQVREVRLEESTYVKIEPSVSVDELERQLEAERAIERAQRALCAAKVRRAPADGDVATFEVCGSAVRR